jgi:hypothetical protein
MRRKGFAERHSIDPESAEHLDIQDCEIPTDDEKMCKLSGDRIISSRGGFTGGGGGGLGGRLNPS